MLNGQGLYRAVLGAYHMSSEKSHRLFSTALTKLGMVIIWSKATIARDIASLSKDPPERHRLQFPGQRRHLTSIPAFRVP